MTLLNASLSTFLSRYERDYVQFNKHEEVVAHHRLTRLHDHFGPDTTSLTQADVDRFLQSLASLAPATRNRYRALIAHLLKWGQEQGLVEGSPLQFKNERELNERTRRLSIEEEETLTSLMSADFKLFFWGALDTGLRFGAQRKLVGRDMRDGTLVVPAPNQKQRRTQLIPLTNRLKSSLTATGSHPLFPPLPKFREEWEWLRKQAGCSDLHWHDLRGEFASRLSEKGVGVDIISKLLGHSDLSMTQRYLRPRVAQFQDAIAALGV